MKWKNEIPTEQGLYLISNPALQQSTSIILVIKFDGELQTHFPLNEGSRKINVNKMSKRFWWLKIPYVPHHKYIDDYDTILPKL